MIRTTTFTTTTSTISPRWDPSAAEVEDILVSMRPLIQRFADRDSELLALWAKAA